MGLRLLTIATLLFASVTMTARGAVPYATDRLEADTRAASMTSAAESAGSDTIVEFSYKGHRAAIMKENGKVVHLGYRIFPREVSAFLPAAPLRFVERFWLEADLPLEREVSVAELMSEDKIEHIGGPMGKIFSVAADTTLTVMLATVNGNRYEVRWISPSGDAVYTVGFPMRYNLMYGTERNENQRRLNADLLAHRYKGTPAGPRSAEGLEYMAPKLYRLRGDIYGFDLNNSDRYYTPADSAGGMLPVCSDSLPIESLANLLTSTELDNSFKVDINLIGYHRNNLQLTVGLNDLLDYFIQKGCKPYFGVIEADSTQTVALVTLHHPQEGYLHNLRVNVPAGVLDSREGTFKARLTPYIPYTKIKALYDDPDPSTIRRPRRPAAKKPLPANENDNNDAAVPDDYNDGRIHYTGDVPGL